MNSGNKVEFSFLVLAPLKIIAAVVQNFLQLLLVALQAWLHSQNSAHMNSFHSQDIQERTACTSVWETHCPCRELSVPSWDFPGSCVHCCACFGHHRKTELTGAESSLFTLAYRTRQPGQSFTETRLLSTFNKEPPKPLPGSFHRIHVQTATHTAPLAKDTALYSHWIKVSLNAN